MERELVVELGPAFMVLALGVLVVGFIVMVVIQTSAALVLTASFTAAVVASMIPVDTASAAVKRCMVIVSAVALVLSLFVAVLVLLEASPLLVMMDVVTRLVLLIHRFLIRGRRVVELLMRHGGSIIVAGRIIRVHYIDVDLSWRNHVVCFAVVANVVVVVGAVAGGRQRKGQRMRVGMLVVVLVCRGSSSIGQVLTL